MKFEYSKHAEEQMLLRNIKREDVEKAIKFPDQILSDENDLYVKIYQYLLKENSQMFLLRIFVNISKSPNKIVTLYKTTKISKYYES